MSGAATQVIYFHGVPGTVSEPELTDVDLSKIFAVDRGTISPNKKGAAYIAGLADHLSEMRAPLHLVGFSIGAAILLRTAALLGDRVQQIDLIAPAAPLELGDFLNHAAGGAVFRMAADYPRSFAAMTLFQALLARFAPKLLMRIMFASASGGDRMLANDEQFVRAMAAILAHSFGPARAGYRRDIATYVAPWAECLSGIASPVRIWQGDADNWSPPMMADAISEALPNGAHKVALSGASHYSSLRSALPQILGT